MKGGGILPRILVACAWGSALLGSAGCGDLPLCRSEVFVAFDQTVIVTDTDAVAPGVQTEIHVRTTLAAGELVELEVDDADGAVLDTISTRVAADGSATFTAVSVPAPRVRLRATGRGLCGIGRAEIMVDVLAGADCAVTLDPAPEPSAYYAPRGVLSTRTDPDPMMPGYQATVRVVTRPGWTAEIFETTPQGFPRAKASRGPHPAIDRSPSGTVDEASLGPVTADAGGLAALPVTLLDGQVGLRAICRGPVAELSSPVTTVVVDTTPPACAIVTPPPGTTLTPLLDEDPGTPEVDVSFAGHAGDGDVAGEPVTLTVAGSSPLPPAIAGTPTGADGTSTTRVTLPALPASSGTYDVALTMRDHAGNLCTATTTYDFVTTGCAIDVTSPRVLVTRDADDDPGNGAQVDIALTVHGPACAGLPVTSVCGTSSPSGIVGSDGTVTLRADLCPAAPCQVECMFTVDNGIPTHASATLAFDDQPRIAALSAVANNRQRVMLAWIAPAGAPDVVGVVVHASPAPITDASFDAAPLVFAGPPGTPGDPQQTAVAVRTGEPRYFAIATVDGAGTRTAARVTGPVTPAFDQTGAIVSPDPPQGALGVGAAIAHGKLNDDDFEDLAIAAPGRDGAAPQAGAVYVYFGGPAGIGPTPDLILTGAADPGGRFGAGLTAIRWSSATRDDLVIGAPGADGGAGQIYVFHGGAGLAGGLRDAATADQTIRVDPSKAGWFATSQLGSALVTADVDGDGTPDLVASAPAGGSGAGGAIIVYGGTVTGDVALSTTDPSVANGAIVELFVEPATAKPGRALGFYLHAVGPTLAAAPRATDDLVIAYADDHATAGDSLYVLRGDGTRPASPGVTPRRFAAGRDVRIDFATSSPVTEWGSQVTSIEDQDDDGVRDLVIGAYRAQGDAGQVLIVSGRVGTAGGPGGAGGVVQTSDPGVTLTTITPAAGVTRLGAVIAGHDAASRADIDGDGHEDLLIGGVIGSAGAGLVWFGGTIGSGPITSATASYVISAPGTLMFSPALPRGSGGQARWIGDINGDGLDDVCWASPVDNSGDGSFEVLWDDAR